MKKGRIFWELMKTLLISPKQVKSGPGLYATFRIELFTLISSDKKPGVKIQNFVKGEDIG
jgi:hypothetical protein